MKPETAVEMLMNDPETIIHGTYVIGVSGGVDSVVLLNLLSKTGMRLIVAHYDHQLRDSAGEDAKFVQRLAETYQLPYYQGTGNVALAAEEERRGIEEEARQQRYQFLFHIARENGCDGVFTAHHADDQVETVLMHFIRGAGSDGMCGMQARSILPVWDERIPLLRPLLSVWRKDIEAYAQEKGLNFVKDGSNVEVRYFRNRLRHEIIPMLEESNPEFKKGVWQTADILGGDREIVTEALSKDWSACVTEEPQGIFRMDYDRMLALPQHHQRNLLREIIKRLAPALRDIGYERINDLQAFFNQPYERKRFELDGDQLFQIHEPFVWCGKAAVVEQRLSQRYPQWENSPLPINFERDGSLQGDYNFQLGWKIHVVRELPEYYNHLDNRFELWCDADRLAGEMTIRRFQPGDRIQPLGMAGKSIKVSDLLINEKVIRYARKHYLVLDSPQGIFWIPGLRNAEFCKITPTTQAVIHLTCRLNAP